MILCPRSSMRLVLFDFNFIWDFAARSRQTCDEIKTKDNEKSSGNYTIDPDGTGPVNPFKAYCNMSVDPAITRIISKEKDVEVSTHPPEQGEGPESIPYKISYIPSFEAAKALARNSKDCKQFIEYKCKKSRLLNDGDPYGRWVAANGLYKNYWGGASPDSKTCACAPKCLEGKTCNCDARKDSWQSDKGDITETNALPVSEVHFGDVNKDKGSFAKYTVGHLYCSGECSHCLSCSAAQRHAKIMNTFRTWANLFRTHLKCVGTEV